MSGYGAGLAAWGVWRHAPPAPLLLVVVAPCSLEFVVHCVPRLLWYRCLACFLRVACRLFDRPGNFPQLRTGGRLRFMGVFPRTCMLRGFLALWLGMPFRCLFVGMSRAVLSHTDTVCHSFLPITYRWPSGVYGGFPPDLHASPAPCARAYNTRPTPAIHSRTHSLRHPPLSLTHTRMPRSMLFQSTHSTSHAPARRTLARAHLAAHRNRCSALAALHPHPTVSFICILSASWSTGCVRGQWADLRLRLLQ